MMLHRGIHGHAGTLHFTPCVKDVQDVPDACNMCTDIYTSTCRGYVQRVHPPFYTQHAPFCTPTLPWAHAAWVPRGSRGSWSAASKRGRPPTTHTYTPACLAQPHTSHPHSPVTFPSHIPRSSFGTVTYPAPPVATNRCPAGNRANSAVCPRLPRSFSPASNFQARLLLSKFQARLLVSNFQARFLLSNQFPARGGEQSNRAQPRPGAPPAPCARQAYPPSTGTHAPGQPAQIWIRMAALTQSSASIHSC
jgi:hypothetical protein